MARLRADDDMKPTDALIPLDPERTRWDVDIPLYIAAVLSTEWDTKNTDHEQPPVVRLAEQMKAVSFMRGGTYIAVYEQPSQSKPEGTPYNWTNDRFTISLELTCARERRDALLMEAEARRVLQSHRNDTFGTLAEQDLSGRQWLSWGIRRTPWKPMDKGYYRRVVDCEVNWRWRTVEGAE